MIKLEITGIASAKRKLRALRKEVLDAMAKSLYQSAEDPIMRESKRETPVDTGTLRSSGHVEQPEVRRRAGTVEVMMGYGGPAGNGEHVGYAVYVHENLTAHHPVGKARYLVDPFNRNAHVVMRYLEKDIRKVLDK